MIVLDTNVVSELMRIRPSHLVEVWILEQPPLEVHITSITLAEILFGIELLPSGKRRSAIQHAAEGFFHRLATPVLPFDAVAAALFAEIAASRRRIGRPIEIMDAQIAAIALSRRASLATRDASDFAHCGVRLLNPWRR